MDFDLLIALLKVIGALVGGILGAAAIFSNFRDSITGKLSAWGKAVLAGIVFSSIIGVVTSIVETWKARNEALDQAAKTESILREINRSLQPIVELNMSSWLEIQQGNKTVDRYIQRLRAGISDRLPALSAPITTQSPTEALKGLHAWARGSDGSVLNVKIDPDSDLWPKEKDEVGISNVLLASSFSIHILKEPVDPEKFQPIFGRTDFGAFSISLGEARLAWDLRNQKLEITAKNEFPKYSWSTNGKISSIEDLKGSQILIFPSHSSDFQPSFTVVSPDIKSAESKEIGRALVLRAVILSFGDGRSIQINSRKWKKSKYVGGYPVFSVVLPSNDPEFVRFNQDNED